jgi:RNA polymerase sigma factor (sigma-70 family)
MASVVEQTLASSLVREAYARAVVREEQAQQPFAVLVAQARSGDADAWRMLCGRLKNVAWKTINSFGLNEHDADDVFAAVFFRLAEHLDSIRDPDYLPGWIATTTRNESYSLLRVRQRTTPVGDDFDDVVDAHDPAERLLDDELLAAVYSALEHLDQPCQELLRLLTAEPPLRYAVVAERLNIPVGSIGPTRERCLGKLRARSELRPFLDGGRP